MKIYNCLINQSAVTWFESSFNYYVSTYIFSFCSYGKGVVNGTFLSFMLLPCLSHCANLYLRTLRLLSNTAAQYILLCLFSLMPGASLVQKQFVCLHFPSQIIKTFYSSSSFGVFFSITHFQILIPLLLFINFKTMLLKH